MVNTARIAVSAYLEEYVDIQRFEAYCQQCESYGQRWSCPPYDFSPLAFWRRFTVLEVIGKRVYPDASLRQQVKGALETNGVEATFAPVHAFFERAKQELLVDLLAREAERNGGRGIIVYQVLQEESTAACIALSAGNCTLCADCTRPLNLPCVYPQSMRFSIESLGGDVTRTMKDLLNLDIQWMRDGHLPDYFSLVGGLLYRE